MFLIDTHCHLDFPEFDLDRDAVIKNALAQGIGYIINIGSSIESSKASIELSSRYDFIYASVGLHPHDADSFSDKVYSELEVLARQEKVVAIGEIGLDYYRNYSKAENQKNLFVSLAKLGKDLGLPLVIHSRNAQEETLKILKSAIPQRIVVHCFSGDENFLKGCLDLGFWISFTCNVTYKKAENLRKLVELVPIDKILLETDAPYLAPEGLRGRRNEPLNVKYVATEISRIKEITIDEVAAITTNNAKNFFGIESAEFTPAPSKNSNVLRFRR